MWGGPHACPVARGAQVWGVPGSGSTHRTRGGAPELPPATVRGSFSSLCTFLSRPIAFITPKTSKHAKPRKTRKTGKIASKLTEAPPPRQPPPGGEHTPAPGGRAATLGPTRLPTSPTCPASPARTPSPSRPLAFISPHSTQQHRGSGTHGTPCHGLQAGGMVKGGKAEEERTRILPCTH